MEDRLIIAVQKNGRLSELTSDLMRQAGLKFANGSSSTLRATSTNFPAEVLYLRNDDIPQCVADGIADVGIVGENLLIEQEQPLEVMQRLGFAHCRLSIAVPREWKYDTTIDLEGKVIATTYPHSLRTFLQARGVNATVRKISGSTEVAPSIGMADAVCDLVSTGSTLMSNGLREVETVVRSQAVIAGAPRSQATRNILDRLMFRVRAVLNARDFKYILLNCPDEKIEHITSLLPGIKSPTVMPLATKGWSSLHTVVRESELWEVVEALRDKGAEGILVLPIQRMVK